MVVDAWWGAWDMGVGGVGGGSVVEKPTGKRQELGKKKTEGRRRFSL